MSHPCLETGEVYAERYEVLKPLGDEEQPTRWLARDQTAGVTRELRLAGTKDTQGLLESRAQLGPYVLQLHAVESFSVRVEDGAETATVLVLAHHPTAVSLASLADTWQSVLLGVLERVAEGLASLHAAGRTLGTLTLSSVRVVSTGGRFSPVLDDLAGDHQVSEVPPGPWLTGDMAFLAPEAMDEAPNSATDVFSLGLVIARALSGCMPFTEDAAVARIRGGPSVLTRRPRDFTADAIDLTRLEPSLGAIVGPCLSLEPSARPTADQVARQLQALSGPAPTKTSASDASPPPRAPSPTAPPTTRDTQPDLAPLSQPLVGNPVNVCTSVTERAPESERPTVTELDGAWGPETLGVPPQPRRAGGLTATALVPLGLALLAGWYFLSDAPPPEAAAPVVLSTVAPPPAVAPPEAPPPPTPQPMPKDVKMHAALPALGCVGPARVYSVGPPQVLEFPCHLRCIVTTTEAGLPDRIVRCHTDDMHMTGEGPTLDCVALHGGARTRCTASLVFLLGDEERRVADTLTLLIGP